MAQYKYKFSVIIPVYNVEEYLEETIQSVLYQTIGFEDNIQLILVNDGSPDNSDDICKKYRDMFPNNVVYVHQKNSGVSAARNKGMEYIEGEIVNFLDSDDKWDRFAFERAYKFFKRHYDEIDVVACMMEFFEAKTGLNHPLNYKFQDGNRIIDIEKEYTSIQMHNSSCFIKSSAIFNKFEVKLKYSEDSLFVNQIIMLKKKYGVLKSVHYMYRKRLSETSALDTSKTRPIYYDSTLCNFHDRVISEFSDKNNKLIPYLQFVLMYELQWRVKSEIPAGVLSKEEERRYIKHLKKLIKLIDDNIILEQKNIWGEHKIYCLDIKCNCDIFDKAEFVDGAFFLNGNLIYNIRNRSLLRINIINTNKRGIKIAGRINCPIDKEDYKIYMIVDGHKKLIKMTDSLKNIKKAVDKELYKDRLFRENIAIDISKITKIKFYLKYKDEDIELLLNFTANGRLDAKKMLHYNSDGMLIYRQNNDLVIRKSNLLIGMKLELYLYLQLIANFKIRHVIYRLIYHLYKIIAPKDIWLISDRTMVANDNGMHLFKYIVNNKKGNEKAYFVIDKKSKDYEKMKRIGKVIAYGSFKYKMCSLLASKIISSQADAWVTNAFGKSHSYYNDLFHFDFVFLQHGIIKDDLSSWLNYHDKNIRIFVTSANREWQSVLDGNYGYDKKIVKLTGLPRYDNLIDDSKKIIAIMPTWRQSLSGEVDKNKGTRKYNPDFKNSEYFNFYNNLISDKRIIKVMKEKGYKGIFVVHPSHMENSVDFQANDTIDVVNGFADYQKIFKEANLLISDFSSVPFDFAYLYKPVIYTQFDKKSFFESHLYTEGYFSYEKDGFGPVLYDYESTVDMIIKYIESDCQMEKKYVRRVDKFFKYHDHNNCKRVYDEIRKIDE